MLGIIINRLTDAATAEAAATAVARPEILARIRNSAAASATPAGAVIASKVRHVLEHGDESTWLDLLSLMSGSSQPGVAAIERVLAYAFPDPVRVRVTRQPSAEHRHR